MKRRKSYNTGLWSLDKQQNDSTVFVRLIYGFCLEELQHKKKDYKNEYDLSHSEFISIPCQRAIICLLCIKKYSDSVLSNVPKDVVLLIAKKVWADRKNFLPFKLEKHSRYMYGQRNTDTYIGVTYDIIPR